MLNIWILLLRILLSHEAKKEKLRLRPAILVKLTFGRHVEVCFYFLSLNNEFLGKQVILCIKIRRKF